MNALTMGLLALPLLPVKSRTVRYLLWGVAGVTALSLVKASQAAAEDARVTADVQAWEKTLPPVTSQPSNN